LPVLAESKVVVGSVKMELIEYSNLTETLTIRKNGPELIIRDTEIQKPTNE
jgi:hypothetical protein